MKKIKKSLGILLCVLLIASYAPAVAAGYSVRVYSPYASGVSYTNATLNSYVSWSGIRPSLVGFYFGASTSSMKLVSYTTSIPSATTFRFYVSLNSLSIVLKPNTYYYYRPLVIQNGTAVYGTLSYFKTPAVSVSFPLVSASKISATSAQLKTLLTYSAPTKPSLIGLYLTTSSTGKIIYSTAIPSATSFYYWSDAAGLTPGTQYYLQPFTTISGVTYWGSKLSFLTWPSYYLNLYTQSTNGIYIQQKAGTNVSAAAAVTMMVRSYLNRTGRSYTGATLEVLMNYCGGTSVSSPFTYSGITVIANGYENISGYSVAQKKAFIAGLLSTHPEGIVLYDWSQPQPRAVYLSDISGGTYYVGDSCRYQGAGRVPLTSSTIFTYPRTQDNFIATIDKIWYIAH